MTSATGPSLTQGWTYDANGNRLTETGTQASTFTVSATSNRLASTAGFLNRTYGYDAAGDALTYEDVTLSYNNRNRLTSTQKGSSTRSYVYNALGQLAKASGGAGGTVLYAYDEAGHLIGEYDGSGALIQETVWLGDIPVATLRPGSPVQILYVHADHLGTPQRITRPSDNARLWQWNKDPFGTLAADENPDSLGAFAYNLRFPGQIFDGQAGLHQNYFRDYSPAVGKYVESDPIGLNGGTFSTYSFVSNDPISFIDPYGLEVLQCAQPAFGWMPVDHWWIKTDTVEAGMGGTKGNVPGNESGDLPGDPVQVTDHSGRSEESGASCKVVPNVDEKKVNEQLKIGRPLGRWWPNNQCRSFVRDVLKNARYSPGATGTWRHGATGSW